MRPMHHQSGTVLMIGDDRIVHCDLKVGPVPKSAQNVRFVDPGTINWTRSIAENPSVALLDFRGSPVL